MVKTTITVNIFNTPDQFESEEFQELLNEIKSGEYQREMRRDEKSPVTNVTVTYWTNYKTKNLPTLAIKEISPEELERLKAEWLEMVKGNASYFLVEPVVRKLAYKDLEKDNEALKTRLHDSNNLCQQKLSQQSAEMLVDLTKLKTLLDAAKSLLSLVPLNTGNVYLAGFDEALAKYLSLHDKDPKEV